MSKVFRGKQMVITRAKDQAGDLIRLIEERGGNAYLFPVIEPVWTQQLEAVDRAIKNVEQYDAILFTSVNGVSFFFRRFAILNGTVVGSGTEEERGIEGESHSLQQIKWVVIGPKTARAVEAYGQSVMPLPRYFKQEELVNLVMEHLHPGMRILHPKAEHSRPYLVQSLRASGFTVDEVTIYETIVAAEGKRRKEAFLKQLEQGQIDVILFTSSSTVENFVTILGSTPWREYIPNVTIACIGPITGRTALEAGLEAHVVADTYTSEGLIEALEQYEHGAQ